MPLPSWLNVQPSDFVSAAQAGARLGTSLAELQSRSAIQREQIAASERENAARINAQQAAAAQRAAQDNSQAEAARAIRDWEIRQRLGMDQERLSMSEGDLANRHALALENLALDKSKLALDTTKEAEAKRKYEEGKLAPVYRTVENQLVKIDPSSGSTTSLFTAPYRPGSTSALDRLLNGTTSTGTNSGDLPPKAGERIAVISPSGQRGTIPAESLDEALKNGYKRL